MKEKVSGHLERIEEKRRKRKENFLERKIKKERVSGKNRGREDFLDGKFYKKKREGPLENTVVETPERVFFKGLFCF